MTVYATRLVNGTDTRERMRRADAMGVFPSGPGMARGGLRRDGGGEVTANAGTMTVDVSPFTGWVDGGVSDAQGGYTFVSDATETLTLAAGHATLERTDVVIAEVRDTTHDGSGETDARVRILEGTPGAGVPALPTNALALRNVTVPAGLSAGTGGLSSGNLSTDRRTYTTGLGGTLTVASQAERDALGALPGTEVYRSDLDQYQVRTAAGWKVLALGEWDDGTLESGGGAAPGWIAGTAHKVVRRNGWATLYVDVTRDSQSGSAAGIMCQAPVGYRPIPGTPNQWFLAVDAASGSISYLYIDSGGNVRTVPARAAGSTTLAAVTYPVGG